MHIIINNLFHSVSYMQ